MRGGDWGDAEAEGDAVVGARNRRRGLEGLVMFCHTLVWIGHVWKGDEILTREIGTARDLSRRPGPSERALIGQIAKKGRQSLG